jgi:hypothetical protein
MGGSVSSRFLIPGLVFGIASHSFLDKFLDRLAGYHVAGTGDYEPQTILANKLSYCPSFSIGVRETQNDCGLRDRVEQLLGVDLRTWFLGRHGHTS